jgi:hypothetical protein
VDVPEPRTGKRITLVACISADESLLKPTIIIPRKTVDGDLVLTGLTTEKLAIRSQLKGYMDTAIFEDWFHSDGGFELNAGDDAECSRECDAF